MKLGKKIQKQMDELEQEIRKSEYQHVLSDLMAFTGFSKKEVLFRILRKDKYVSYGASGWFEEEFEFFNPKTPKQLTWFYRCAQSYLFTNARKPYWDYIDKFEKAHSPIIDYGAGIGQTIMELERRKFKTYFFEIGFAQRDFIMFRAKRQGLTMRTFEPYYRKEFDSIRGVRKIARPFGGIVLQHVLEHIPNYPVILKHLISKLRPGGMILEQSPFTKMKGDGYLIGKGEIGPNLHFKERVPLFQVMLGMGMILKEGEVVGKKSWSEPRIWVKR